MKKNIIIVLVSVLLSALTAFLVVKLSLPESGKADDSNQPKRVSLAVSDYPDFTYAAENSVDAVVYVEVTVRSQQQEILDPFLKFFFGDQYNGQGRERVQQGSGSGVIIRPDGYIVTNNHVVSGATEIVVTLNNNKTYPATIIGTDPATDVAIIKIEPETELPAFIKNKCNGSSITKKAKIYNLYYISEMLQIIILTNNGKLPPMHTNY